MSGTRERRHERTRQAILSTALQLIAEQGPDKLSLREIARRIDYSPAGLYEYFGSKEELIDAVCVEADCRLKAFLQSVPDTLPPVEYLTEIGMAYIQFARQNPECFLFMFNHRTLPSDVKIPGDIPADDNFMLLYNAAQEAVDTGVVQTRENYGEFEISYSLWALGHGMAMLQVKYLHDFPLDFESADRIALENFLKGLGAS